MSAKRIHKFPKVAIVGRANVGKSTLFNRMTETTHALVSAIPNTTRDRKYGLVVWRGMGIEVIDTGGLDAEQGSEIGRGILSQAHHAIKEADLVVFLIDAQTGPTLEDNDLARHVRSLNSHIFLVANKVDHPRDIALTTTKEVWALSLGEAQAISGALGRGIGDLLDNLFAELAKLNKIPQSLDTEESLKLVIMGRPNVGKSSLMNAVLGEDRVIVSATPHTTREPQDTTFEWNGERVTLIDTAGMRKRSRVEPGIEEASLEKNRAALMQADIALLVFDATSDPTTQDKHLAGLLQDAGRGLILVANKWDLVKNKTTTTTDEYERLIRQTFPFLDWAPMIFISAKNKQRTDAILDLALVIREERKRRIIHNALQRFLKTVVARKRPLSDLGPKSPYLHEVEQIGINPPSFLITVRGEKESVHPSWIRYFEKRLREKFGFHGTPLLIKARNVPMAKTSQTDESAKNAAKRKTRKKRPIGRRMGRY